MNPNMDIWGKVKRPPEDALKTIFAGRLKGMTDISPQWRYQVLTEVFGVCGFGWKYEIKRLWTESGSADQVMVFAEVLLFICVDGKFSDPIPGIGGSTLIAKEKNGLHTSDEAYKMAVTDALSVATKMLGVAADIYSGKWDGSKYKDEPKEDNRLPDNKIDAYKNSITNAKTTADVKRIWEQAFEECKKLGDRSSADSIKEHVTQHLNMINNIEDVPQ